MQDVLILSASFGMGHNSVSRAIKEQIEMKDNNLKIDIVDIFDILNPSLKSVGTKIYYNLTEHYPEVYNKIYNIKKSKKNNVFDSLLCNTYYKKLYNYLVDNNPKVIVSAFPLCSCVVSKVKKKYDLDINLVTVITDVVDSWEWVYEYTNMYFVPTESIREKLIEKGVSKNRIEVTGIPVKSSFLTSNIDYNQRKNTLLVIATGMTGDDISPSILSQLDNQTRLKTVIVTGRNKQLYEKLILQTYKNIQVLGFVDNIDKLMDEAVFLVTKPGGITVFEAINKEVPLVIKDSNIGQEKGNVDFIRSNNLGIVIDDKEDLFDAISEYAKNPHRTDEYAKNIIRIKNNLKSYRIADCVINKVRQASIYAKKYVYKN